jgi:cytochrome c553
MQFSGLRWLSGLKWRLLVRHGGILVTTAFVAGVIFVWSGFYNVAASSDHWVVTTWILERVRVNSVATRSYFVEDPPPLDDPDLIRLGAGHYEGGCAPCHGSPGEPRNAIVRRMLPAPPLLPGAIEDETPKELFWIVKHGLKYTAMPAWPAQERDDEVWTLVAFLRQLPGMTEQEYARLATGNASLEEDGGESGFGALTECSRCHDTPEAPPTSALIPRLAGQSEAYLQRALAEYAAGVRPSGVMHPVALELEAEEIRAFADYYASLPGLGVPQPLSAEPTSERERGRLIATRGVPEDGIPPCLACHSGTAEAFPLLAGQSAAYLAGQLALWQHGLRDQTTYGSIMAPIAQRLTAEQIRDVTLYFESLGPSAVAAGVVR